MPVSDIQSASLLAHTQKLVDGGAQPSDLVGYYLGVAAGLASAAPNSTLPMLVEALTEIWEDIQRSKGL